MKPILFNTEMVRAILDGRKTVTRRVVKPQPEGAHTILDCDEEAHTFDFLCGNGGAGGVFADWAETIKAPYWPGDVLYVRETYTVPDGSYAYKASMECPDVWKGTWRPCIHMSKEAARIFLRVTVVKVERLQDITEEDAVREGFSSGHIEVSGGPWGVEDDPEEWTAKEEFSDAWDTTIKPADRDKYGWAANPWCWVIGFERISKEEAKEDG